jgi:hypothetical protein
MITVKFNRVYWESRLRDTDHSDQFSLLQLLEEVYHDAIAEISDSIIKEVTESTENEQN